MPLVEVSFTPLPVHVRTARLVAGALARRAGVGEDLLDEIRLAVGEACSRAVGVHQRHAPDRPVLLQLTDDGGRLTVTVVDAAPGEPAGAVEDLEEVDPEALAAPRGEVGEVLPAGFGLAVIAGLVDDVTIGPAPGGTGTAVRMSWPAVAAPASRETAAGQASGSGAQAGPS